MFRRNLPVVDLFRIEPKKISLHLFADVAGFFQEFFLMALPDLF